ncbi:LacI family DNA-binding transcriptional regulator [Achromobacter aloeverae]|uniref:GntR family transcriptional regulator n=1 Tax=Achromobacter aloeverae TaxID=1750518 RepID=A0A4Q1HGC7_9BURK|nr:LacI family DNA-binding transcriptional regulator [Achromobacter aloeverae]RXN85224.1 GntR family transcriptional regulator [Achromobacter aloeverae]
MTATSDPSRHPGRAQDKGGVTLREVARAANVSMITVSRAINNPRQVSAITLEKVNAAIQALGYVPNLMAGGLRSSRSYLVMALVPTIAGSLFSGMLQALTVSLEAKGYQLMVGQIGYEPDDETSREDALLRAIIGRRPDGIVLTGIMHSAQGRQLLKSSGIPVVETWDSTPTPIDMLLSLSHDAIGRAVCDYLHAAGKSRCAILTGDDERARRRAAGYRRRARELGLPEPLVHPVPAPTTHADGRAGLRAVLARDPSIQAVFCTSDMMAIGVITEAVARGLSLPGQLAVMGFGDMDIAASMTPSLTTVRVDGAAIGATAAEMIATRANGRAPPQAVVDIGFSIVRRDSA